MIKKCSLLSGLWLSMVFCLAVDAAPDRLARFEHISLEEGLSQSVVNWILRDHLGLLWFATQDGLNCYDGYQFTIYRKDPDDPNSITDNWVSTLYEDGQNRLWVGTDDGLCVFDRGTARFSRFYPNPDRTRSEGINRLNCIYPERSSRLWVGTRGGGVLLFDPATARFQSYRHDPAKPASLSHDRVQTLLVDRQDTLWVGPAKPFLDRFDPVTRTFTHFRVPGTSGGGPTPTLVQCLFELDDKRLLVGTDRGLFIFDKRSGRFQAVESGPATGATLAAAYIDHVIRARNGELWVATTNGLFRLDPGLTGMAHYSHDPTQPDSLSSNDVQFLLEDDSRIVWIGTYSGGIDKLDLKKEQFRTYTAQQNDRRYLSNPFILSFFEAPDGILWIGTENGLNRITPGKGGYDLFEHDPANPHSISKNRVQAIAVDARGNLWVGTEDGLNFSQAGGERFTCFRNDPADPRSLSFDDVMGLLPDSKGRLWVGTYRGGLNLFEPESRTFRRFTPDPADTAGTSGNYVSCLYEDSRGTIWVGTNGGLFRFRPETGTFQRFVNDPANPQSLTMNRIRCLHEDRRGRFWVGTRGGLNLFDRQSGRCRRYTSKDGLPNDFIYGILEDNQGRLWMSTNRGLSRFDPESGRFRNFDAQDGLQSNEFNQGAHLRLRNGEMLFGGINGFNRFHPDQIRDNRHVPPLLLTSFKIFGKEARLPQHVSVTREITLDYTQNSFSFEFAALDFTNPRKNQYAFKLVGFNDDFMAASTSRVATYTNLDGGDYVLRVKGANNDGVWNDRGLSIKLTVIPPIYQRWWFRIAAILALSALVNVVYFGGRRLLNTYLAWKKSSFIAHFRVLGTLGRGGMGTVYKALNFVTKETVALKVLHPELTDEVTKRRFVQEGLICERVAHPCIVKIFERGEHNGRLYYAMEYLEGTVLRQYLNKGPLPDKIALLLFRFLHGVLRDIHAAGIIHRDIKPENMMLRKDFDLFSLLRAEHPAELLRQNLKLLDFGLAKVGDAKSLTQAGLLSGTVYYLPPETLSGKHVADPSQDIYSLGIMLYEMLTGRQAFPGEDPVAVMYALLYRMPVPPREANPVVSEAVSGFTLRLIEKDPATRLKGAEEITIELSRLLSQGV